MLGLDLDVGRDAIERVMPRGGIDKPSPVTFEVLNARIPDSVAHRLGERTRRRAARSGRPHVKLVIGQQRRRRAGARRREREKDLERRRVPRQHQVARPEALVARCTLADGDTPIERIDELDQRAVRQLQGCDRAWRPHDGAAHAHVALLLRQLARHARHASSREQHTHRRHRRPPGKAAPRVATPARPKYSLCRRSLLVPRGGHCHTMAAWRGVIRRMGSAVPRA